MKYFSSKEVVLVKILDFFIVFLWGYIENGVFNLFDDEMLILIEWI